MELWRTVCKETWLLTDAATLEKLPGVDIAVEHGLQPTGTGYSAEISYTGKKIIVSLLKVFSRDDSTDWADLAHTDMAQVMQLTL